MKSLVSSAFALLACSFVSSAAFAYPAVNDSVVMNGSYAEQGQSAPLSLATTLKAFNASTGQFLYSESQTLGGKTSTQDSWIDQGDLVTPAQIQNLIANCQAQGGAPEALTTPAGVFNTCRITQQESDGSQTYWFADVPFGVAQLQINGTSDQGVAYAISLTLASFTSGQ